MPVTDEYVEWSIIVEEDDANLLIRLERRTRTETTGDQEGAVVSGMAIDETGLIEFPGLLAEASLHSHGNYRGKAYTDAVATLIRRRLVEGGCLPSGFEVEKIRKWVLSHHPKDFAERLGVIDEYVSYSFRSIERDYRSVIK